MVELELDDPVGRSIDIRTFPSDALRPRFEPSFIISNLKPFAIERFGNGAVVHKDRVMRPKSAGLFQRR